MRIGFREPLHTIKWLRCGVVLFDERILTIVPSVRLLPCLLNVFGVASGPYPFPITGVFTNERKGLHFYVV